MKNKPTINTLRGTGSVELYKRQMNKLKQQLEDKDKELSFYQKQHGEMQKHLDSFQFSARKSDNQSSVLLDDFNSLGTPRGSQKENIKIVELQRELKEYKSKCEEYEEIHQQRQKQDAFETMIVNIENYLQDESVQKILTSQKRMVWENEAGMLLSQYQEDQKELHDKYIQQLCVLYKENLPQIHPVDELFLEYNQKLECYLNIAKVNNSNSTIEELNSEQEEDNEEENEDEEQHSFNEFEEIKESALRVMEDIDKS